MCPDTNLFLGSGKKRLGCVLQSLSTVQIQGTIDFYLIILHVVLSGYSERLLNDGTVSFDKCYHSKRYLQFHKGKSGIIGKGNLTTKVILSQSNWIIKLNNQIALLKSIIRYHGAGTWLATSRWRPILSSLRGWCCSHLWFHYQTVPNLHGFHYIPEKLESKTKQQITFLKLPWNHGSHVTYLPISSKHSEV